MQPVTPTLWRTNPFMDECQFIRFVQSAYAKNSTKNGRSRFFENPS